MDEEFYNSSCEPTIVSSSKEFDMEGSYTDNQYNCESCTDTTCQHWFEYNTLEKIA